MTDRDVLDVIVVGAGISGIGAVSTRKSVSFGAPCGRAASTTRFISSAISSSRFLVAPKLARKGGTRKRHFC